MARKPITTFEIKDDLTGEVISEDDAELITFSYGGVAYEIDLSKKNARKLDEFLAPYIDKARKVRTGSGKNLVGQSASNARKFDLNAVREWAGKNGYEVAPRGRVAQTVIDAYVLAGN